MACSSARRRVLAALLVATAAVAGLTAAPPTAHADEPAKVLLLLDVSGSMNEEVSSGGTKLAAAKRALKQVANALPAGAQVGLRVYGSEIAESQKTEPRACRDTELVMPVGPLDRQKMYRAVDSFRAVGETPIAYSLGKAVNDLGDAGRRVVVLISDGEENCTPDPCPTARKLADRGVDLQFNAIGFDVGSKARKQLRCTAEAGDGSYYDADRSDELAEALRKITQRALRPYAISGTPVTSGADPSTAPQIGVGQYQDRFGVEGDERFYAIARTPGEIVTASVNSLVPPSGSYNAENWDLELATADGERCDAIQTLNETQRTVLVVSGAVVSGAVSAPPACATEPLVLSVQRRVRESTKKAPAEIVVTSEPVITNLAAVPDPIESYAVTGKAVPDRGKDIPVVGGSSFSDAAALTPGTYTDAPAVGESPFYKVSLQPGQRLATTVTAPASRSGWSLTSYQTATVASVIYAPSRVPLTKQSVGLQGDNGGKATAYSPQVRVRNREIPHESVVTTEGDPRDNASYASVGGDYYVSVQARAGTADVLGRVLPIKLTVRVDGTPTGLPVYAPSSSSPPPIPSPSGTLTPGPTPAASSVPPTTAPPTTTPPGELTPGWGSLALAGGIGAAVAGVGVVVVTAIRKRRGI